MESFILDQDDLDDQVYDTSKFLLTGENMDAADLRNVDPETQERLEALLEAAGILNTGCTEGGEALGQERLY